MSVNRTICDVLEAMRKCYETRNFSYMMGLVEEIQDCANKMEAALWDQNDFKYAQKELKKLKTEKKKLELEVEKLEEKKEALES